MSSMRLSWLRPAASLDELETASGGDDAPVAGKRRAGLFGLDPVRHRRSEAWMAALRAQKAMKKKSEANLQECRELDAELNKRAAKIGDLNKVQRRLKGHDVNNMSSSSGHANWSTSEAAVRTAELLGASTMGYKSIGLGVGLSRWMIKRVVARTALVMLFLRDMFVRSAFDLACVGDNVLRPSGAVRDWFVIESLMWDEAQQKVVVTTETSAGRQHERGCSQHVVSSEV